MRAVFVCAIASISALILPATGKVCDDYVPYIIDLTGGTPIEETEALIKQYFDALEFAILSAKRNASLLTVVRSAQGLPGPAFPINVGNVMARAYCNRPMFRLPTLINRAKSVTPNATRLTAPLCGPEIQRLACQLLSNFNDGRVFLSPFDLDELVSNDSRGSTPWHRNSPLISMTRLCVGLKAMTKLESAETCIGSLILEKLRNLINNYNAIPSPDDNQNSPNRRASVIYYGNRYFTVKAILKNFGYDDQGTAVDHTTGNGVDILCGPSAGIDGGAERNCSVIASLCQSSSSTNVVTPAEGRGCGTPRSPLTSVHCAFFNRPIVSLANMTVDEVTDKIKQHYEVFEKQTRAVINDTVFNVVKAAITQNMTASEAMEAVKDQITPKLVNIIVESYENGITFNVSQMPRRNYAVQFKSIGFRISPGNSAIENILRRDKRQAVGSIECPSASVEMAKQLLEMYSQSGKVVFLPYIFTKVNMTSIMQGVNATVTALSQQQDTATVASSQSTMNTSEAVRIYILKRRTLQVHMANAMSTTVMNPSITTRTNVQVASSTSTSTTTTTITPTTTTTLADSAASADARSYGALENMVRLAYGQKAFNSDGTSTCISYETLRGIYVLANQFYDTYQQPLYVAALTGTEYHSTVATEPKAHYAGLAVDTLCGLVYRHSNAANAGSSAVDPKALYCTEVANGCFQTKMFDTANSGSSTGCLADSVLQLFGSVHCRLNR